MDPAFRCSILPSLLRPSHSSGVVLLLFLQAFGPRVVAVDITTSEVTSDGYWLRPGDATYIQWTFRSLDSEVLGPSFDINFALMVTNAMDGGSGYSTAVKVTISSPDGKSLIHNELWLTNLLAPGPIQWNLRPVPLQGTDPSNSYGFGYTSTCSLNSIETSFLIGPSGVLQVKVEWLPGFQVQDAFGIWNPHVGSSYLSSGVTLTAGRGTPSNHAPIADAGSDQSALIGPGQNTVSVALDGSWSSDPDGNNLTYRWLEGGVEIATGQTPDVDLGPGTHTITLIVSDGSLTAEATVVVRVITHAPTATIVSISPTVLHAADNRTTITFTGSGTDDQGHRITGYRWRAGSKEIGTLATITAKPVEIGSTGVVPIGFQVTCDAGYTSSEDTSSITLSPPPLFTMESSDIDWIRLDLIEFNGQSWVYVELKAGSVEIDEVYYRLRMLGSGEVAHERRVENIPPGTADVAQLFHNFTWKWDMFGCKQLIPDPGIQLYPYWATADVKDVNGYEFTLKYPTKENQYRELALVVDGDKIALYEGSFWTFMAEIEALIHLNFKLYDDLKKLAEFSCKFAHDPWAPDPDFANELTVSLPDLDEDPVCGEADPIGEKVQAADLDARRLGASLPALFAVIPKMLGADQAQDLMWFRIHAADALRFGEWAAEDMESFAGSLETAKRTFGPLDAGDIDLFKDQIRTQGFPAEGIDYLRAQGLSDAEIEDLRQEVLAADSEAVAQELTIDRSAVMAAHSSYLRGLTPAAFPLGKMATAIVAPREGSWVRGTVHVRSVGWCTESGNPPVDNGLFVDGPQAQIAPRPPCDWDSTQVADGPHSLIHLVKDTMGRMGGEAVNITVDNTAPALSISSPMEKVYALEDLPIPITFSLSDNLDPKPHVRCLLLDGEPVTSQEIWPSNGGHVCIVRAVDKAGNRSEARVDFTVEIPGCSATGVREFGPFTDPDFDHGHAIGTPCPAASISSPEAGTLVIRGAGADIWKDGDQCMYAYSLVPGDFSAQVRVADRQFAPGSRWGKLGIMVRQDCTDRSRFSFTADNGEDPEDNVRFMARPTHGGSDNFELVPPGTFLHADVLRLDRCGSIFIGYVLDEMGEFGGSPGEWVELGRHDWGPDAPRAVLVGLAVTSHQDCNIATATFEDWQLSPRCIGLPLDPAGMVPGALSSPGFSVRTVSASGAIQIPSQCEALMLLDGLIQKDLDVSESPSVINMAAGGASGEISGDSPFPGLNPPASTDDFALEATGWLDLPEGPVTLGVSSDDGFTLWVGKQRVMGFPENRGPATSTVTLGVAEAGPYPFCLAYHNRSGGAELEFLQTIGDGSKALVNDAAKPDSIRAFRMSTGEWPTVESCPMAIATIDLDPAAKAPGRLSKPGFRVRTVRAREPLEIRTEADARDLLDGKLASDLDVTEHRDVINLYHSGGQGIFAGDLLYPGLAVDAIADDVAAETSGWLDLPLGDVTLHVSSDDGFTLVVGSQVVMAFRGDRSPMVSSVNLHVTLEGPYPFRLTYHNGTGGAEVEFFQTIPGFCPGCGAKVLISDPSDTRSVRAYGERAPIGGIQRPGDCNGDGVLDISDPISLLGFLFLGTPSALPCGNGKATDSANLGLLDSNGDGGVDISDPLYLFQFLFLGGSPPVLGKDCIPLEGCPDNSARCGS